MEKRLKVSGFIDLPAGAELPPIGTEVKGEFVGEVRGEHTDQLRSRGGEKRLVKTAPVTMDSDSSIVTSIAPPDRGPTLDDVNDDETAED